MRGYSESVVFSREQLADLRAAERAVAAVPEKQEDGDWVRCHELARAVATVLGNRWHVVDGKIHTVEHTWLVWRGRGHVVLDVYTVARLPQVQLLDLNPLWSRNTYIPGGTRRDVREEVVQWLRRKFLTVQETAATLGS